MFVYIYTYIYMLLDINKIMLSYLPIEIEALKNFELKNKLQPVKNGGHPQKKNSITISWLYRFHF